MNCETGTTPDRAHLMLTVLGRGASPTTYTLGDREAEATLAPVALFDLLADQDRPDRVLAVCTPEAKQASFPKLKEALGTRCLVESVEVPRGDEQDHIDKFLANVTAEIRDNVELTVDVTHGFRHFSFLTYVAVLYLSALRGVTVRGAYYGLLGDSTSPFLDLRPLLDLPRWIHALEVLQETGSAIPMAEILDERPDQSARDNARALRRLSKAYLSGLPLELGQQAGNLVNQRQRPLRRLLRQQHRLPLAKSLVRKLVGELEPLALDGSLAGNGWKRQIGVSRGELERQVQVINRLLAHDNYAVALGLMREWTVSWVVSRRTPDGDWLGSDRSAAERMLHAISSVSVGHDNDLSEMLTGEQVGLGGFWKHLTEVRNAYAHHGMRPRDLVGDAQFVSTRKRVVNYWKKTLSCLPDFPVSLGGSPHGRILVSPIGRRPGVLFSALHVCRADGDDPALCLVVCSRETKGLIAEACERAKYDGRVQHLMLDDAYGGVVEVERLAKGARGSLIGATELFVNVTGGTTLMGLAAERLAETARRLACPVRRFGLVDRRGPEQQDAAPYQVGEPFWLDTDEANAHRD